MIKKIASVFSILILLSFLASANSRANFKAATFLTGQVYGDTVALSRTDKISTKKGEKYDEAKDPALRKGTENWEQPQGNFWIVPVAVVGLVFAILFFSKE